MLIPHATPHTIPYPTTSTQDNPKPIRTQPSCWTMFNFRDDT